uniref:Uncharacterized protein n=1 Tax=Naja naja TaxID=35670 RepID=A0A8C6YDF8_NAJNA
MGASGGEARDGAAAPPVAASGLPAGPARFRCPEDFCAQRLAPGAAFCPENLGTPGKRLLLICAPADFRPERCVWGRSTGPRGSPRGSAGLTKSAARLLIAAGRPERLTCAQPFGGSLKIQERDGAPDAALQLFPVGERPPLQVPAGLKQRFFPFGARLPSSGAPPRKAARERGKKRPLLPWKQAGPEQLLGGSPEPAEALLGRAGSKQRPLKEAAEEPAAAAAATGPATLPGLGGRLLWQDARPSGHLEAASWSGEAEEPGRRRARKKEKKRKTGLETEELPDPSSRYWQPEGEPRLQGGRELEGGGCRTKETKAGAEELWGAAAIKEELGDVPCLGSLPEENPRATGEDPSGEVPGCKKKKKKKKKKERRSQERASEGLWGVFAIKEEPGDVPCLGSLPEEGLGSPREEPGRELAGYIKRSPGKGAGGLWSVGALKEELGDIPSLGSFAEESLGVTPEDPAGEPPSCKKRKKKKSRERAAEGLWGMAALKEEPGDSCLGSLPEEGLGPAGELLACRKKEEKLDKEPLWEQGTETQQHVLDWAAPLSQEAEELEEPWQTNRAATSPRPKKKGRRRRERGSQAGLFAAGT